MAHIPDTGLLGRQGYSIWSVSLRRFPILLPGLLLSRHGCRPYPPPSADVQLGPAHLLLPCAGPLLRFGSGPIIKLQLRLELFFREPAARNLPTDMDMHFGADADFLDRPRGTRVPLPSPMHGWHVPAPIADRLVKTYIAIVGSAHVPNSSLPSVRVPPARTRDRFLLPRSRVQSAKGNSSSLARRRYFLGFLPLGSTGSGGALFLAVAIYALSSHNGASECASAMLQTLPDILGRSSC